MVATFSEELDKVTAENKSLYLISGVTIDSIRQRNDLKSVELYISNLDLTKSYNLITLAGIKDLAVPANLSTAKAVMIYAPKPTSR